MNISVGSTNPAKIAAVQEFFPQAEVTGVKADSQVSDQPLTLNEAITGAKNRAKNAYTQGMDYSVGIEAGIMPIHDVYYFFNACAVYDGSKEIIGLSSMVALPQKVTHTIITEGKELIQALVQSGLTPDTTIAKKKGFISILTKGRLTRSQFSQEALRMAWVQVEQQELYQE